MKNYEEKTGNVSLIKEHRPIISAQLTQSEILCLYAFKITMLRYDLGNSYYFGNYSEYSTCIYKDENNWEVYDTERGYAHNKMVFDNVYEACLYAIKMITKDKSVEESIINTFIKLSKKDYARIELEKFLRYNGFDKENITEDDIKNYELYNEFLNNTYNNMENSKIFETLTPEERQEILEYYEKDRQKLHKSISFKHKNKKASE